MSQNKGLSNNKQALAMLLILLTWVGGWIALGGPTDKASLLTLTGGSVSSLVLLVKEALGSSQ